MLAAVSLLAILYVTLARVAIDGLRHEGESRRRLEASLVADLALAALETGLVEGVLPDLGTEEREEGDYKIFTEVTPYALPELEEEPTLPGGRRETARPDPRGTPTLFPSALAIEPPPVRTVRVRVVWLEGEQERALYRTTYGLDRLAADAALSNLSTTPADAQ